MNITRIGIDLAKNTFSICGVDNHDKIVVERTLKRKELLGFFANTLPCFVAMEVGSGAHHWARELIKLGHEARIMDPKFVAPYRTGGRATKSDHKSQWAEHLKASKSWNKTAVTLANKHARIIWTLLAKDQTFHPA